jgi:hypothetical protein
MFIYRKCHFQTNIAMAFFAFVVCENIHALVFVIITGKVKALCEINNHFCYLTQGSLVYSVKSVLFSAMIMKKSHSELYTIL